MTFDRPPEQPGKAALIGFEAAFKSEPLFVDGAGTPAARSIAVTLAGLLRDDAEVEAFSALLRDAKQWRGSR